MKQTHIDFAPITVRRTFLTTKWFTWFMATSGLLLILLSSVSAYRLFNEFNSEREQLSLIKHKADTQKNFLSANQKHAITETQADAVNVAVRQLNLPWSELLDAIEAATPRSIAILILEPEANKATLKATAEAKNSDEMISYVEQLKRQTFFSTVILTKHEVNEQDPNRPIRFQFEAKWSEED